MFIYDKPIEREEDDFLGRKNFSQHLGNALLDWKEKESLVIAICGEWGSGKSSVINLAVKNIENSNNNNKPTIIEFNPWSFSEEDNLGGHFFDEIAKQLEVKKDTDKDIKIAKKLKLYASVLSFTPEQTSLDGLWSKTLLISGLMGIGLSQIAPPLWLKNLLLILGCLLIVVDIIKGYLVKFANYFEKKADYHKESVAEIKKGIKKELALRGKKLVVIIDDIDRLNKAEMRKIFRLIRVNADFPNTIYLLAFDRKIVEQNLEEQKGVSGKDYLDKIVQVNFDVPFAKPSKISAYLFKELDRVLALLPESSQNYFDPNDPYWPNIYHSGFKDLFKNIRDVKRYASSLEFNISQMFQAKVMEVNPVDFMAVEAIRVFVPDFYLFMRNKGAVFTSTERDTTSRDGSNPRKAEIEEALSRLAGPLKESVTKLIIRLFPQVEGVFQYGYSTHGHEWQSTWNKNLRVCATNNFDSYFTLIPGGDEDELSRFEIENLLDKAHSVDEFEKAILEYIGKGKIRKVLTRLQEFTDDQNRISQDSAKNIIKALYNISDDLDEEKIGMWDFGADMDLMRIIYQLLKRETDKGKNFELLKEAIATSRGIYGPVQDVSLESSRKKKERDSDEFIVPEEKIEELQKLCLIKIKGAKLNDLIKNKNLVYILYHWKDWDKEDTWKRFIKDVTNDDTKLILFLDKFISESRSQTIGDYGFKTKKEFNYKSLESFVDVPEIKTRLELAKKEDGDLYKKNMVTIDLFLDNFVNKDEKDI